MPQHIFKPQEVARSEDWVKSQDEEARFWEGWIHAQGRSGTLREDYARLVDPGGAIQGLIARRQPLSILDVGSGPMTVVGKSGNPAKVTAIDPLADRYSQLFERSGVILSVPTRQMMGEEIAFQFPLNYFDVTFAHNVLDRSDNPAYIIDQMLAVTRPGGWVGLEHRFAEHTRGKAQWDFLLDPDMECVVERSGGDCSVNLADRYDGIVEMQTEVRTLPLYNCWCSVWMKKLVATS